MPDPAGFCLIYSSRDLKNTLPVGLNGLVIPLQQLSCGKLTRPLTHARLPSRCQ